MDEKELRQLIFIGRPDTKNEKKHAYALDTIYRWIKEKQDKNEKPTDPIDQNYEIPQTQVDDIIMKKFGKTKKQMEKDNKQLKEDSTVNKKDVTLNIELVWCPANNPLMNKLNFEIYKVEIKIKSLNKQILMGYIPDNLEKLPGVDTSSTTFALIGTLQKLWDSDKLLKIVKPLSKIEPVFIWDKYHWVKPNNMYDLDYLHKLSSALKDIEIYGEIFT
jgi:hypothetical protein